MRGEVHEGPWPATERPRLRLVLALEAGAGLGRAGRVELDPKRDRELIGGADEVALLPIDLLEERRLRPRQTLAIGEIDEALQVDFADADLVRQPDKIRK